MKRMVVFRSGVLAALVFVVAGSVPAQDASKAAESNASKLVYADFQNLQNGRPVSKRGGMTRLNRYSENATNPPQFRGLENADPPAPALARYLPRCAVVVPRRGRAGNFPPCPHMGGLTIAHGDRDRCTSG